MFKIVILAGSAHNFNFSVNSCMLVKVACLKTFEEVMNGNNSTAVVAREEDKARSKHRRILKNSQNKTSLENAGGLGRSEPRKGRTIRKVMGGEGNFRAARIFFRYQILCMNFI